MSVRGVLRDVGNRSVSGGAPGAGVPASGSFRGIRQVDRPPGHPRGRALPRLQARGVAERNGSAAALRHAVLEDRRQRLRAGRSVRFRRGAGQSH